ncbi:GapS6b family protein [Arsenophonus nasoniae]|uniref:PIN domain-containing protein n=1 Tax=Arsenophonus nasoniae TaxID=638 RepID=A0AA95GG16_9GAMM|nr:hypothetical protein [Arsenophonus nasoniae]WGL96309.1 hypothetical protein QE207_07025 [Arsenophonus nasoniae]
MVNQNHSGSGDNVANKYEYNVNSIEPKELKSVIDIILSNICYRNISIAKKNLDLINQIGSLNNDVKLLLRAIEIKIDLVNGITSLPPKQPLLRLLNQNKTLPTEIIDVITSILINLESRIHPDIAKERYNNIEDKNAYLNEVFYEHLASNEEIQLVFNSQQKHELLEQEITGLLRGALRLKNYKLAVEISLFLYENFHSNNATTLMIYSKSCFFVQEYNQKHFWLLPKKIKQDIDSTINGLVIHFNNNINIDKNICSLINLLNATGYHDKRLAKLGNKFKQKIKEIDEHCANIIEELTPNLDVAQITSPILEQCINPDEFSKLILLTQHNRIDTTSLKNWLDNDGNIKTNDSYLNTFLKLQLRSLLCQTDDMQAIFTLSIEVENFLDLDKSRLFDLHPSGIIQLCDRLIKLKLPLLSLKLIESLITEDLWVSPVLECYINALYSSEKFELLFFKLSQISDDDKTEFIWSIEARALQKIKEFDLSIKAIRAAINLSSINPYSWYLLLFVSRHNGVSIEQLRKIVFEIPENIFSTYHNEKLCLISEIAAFIDTHLAEKILVDWFVQNPNELAKPLIDIHLCSLNNRPKDKENPYQPDYCINGVRYSDGFETFLKILVKDIHTNNSYLLKIDSPLGKLIDNLSAGETIKPKGHPKITLIERLSPYAAAFQIASDIRSQSNDGTDTFKAFKIPSNNAELLPFLEQILSYYPVKNNEPNPTLDNPNFPLATRGMFHSVGGSLITTALHHLMSNKTTKYITLFDQGDKKPKKIIIDIYTAVYLALTELLTSWEKLAIEIVLSEHTKFILEQWINDISRENYLSLSFTENGIGRCTAKEIARDLSGLIKQLKKLLTLANIEIIKPIDTPDDLLKIKNYIDQSVYSTIQLSIINQIPLLSIDSNMSYIAQHLGSPVANMFDITAELIKNSSWECRKNSIKLNLLNGLPIPIFPTDIVQLSQSIIESDIYLVAKYVEKYGVPSNASPTSSLNFLRHIILQTIATAASYEIRLKGSLYHNPRYNGYAKYVFNACCRKAISILSGETAEQRIALLLTELIYIPMHIRDCIELILRFASSFIEGHFLNIDAINNAMKTYYIERHKKSSNQ